MKKLKILVETSANYSNLLYIKIYGRMNQSYLETSQIEDECSSRISRETESDKSDIEKDDPLDDIDRPTLKPASSRCWPKKKEAPHKRHFLTPENAIIIWMTNQVSGHDAAFKLCKNLGYHKTTF